MSGEGCFHPPPKQSRNLAGERGGVERSLKNGKIEGRLLENEFSGVGKKTAQKNRQFQASSVFT